MPKSSPSLFFCRCPSTVQSVWIRHKGQWFFLLQNWSQLGTGGPQSLTNNHPSTAVKQRKDTPPSYSQHPIFSTFGSTWFLTFGDVFFSSPRSVRDTLRIQAYLGFSGMSMLSPNFTTSTIVVRKATARATARCFGVKYSFGGGGINGSCILRVFLGRRPSSTTIPTSRFCRFPGMPET